MDSGSVLPIIQEEIISSNVSLDIQEEIIPPEFCCPITGDIMVDPVISPDGFSYEKSAITRWLSDPNNVDPLTRSPYTISQYSSNRALKEIIERFKSSLPANVQLINLSTNRSNENSFSESIVSNFTNDNVNLRLKLIKIPESLSTDKLNGILEITSDTEKQIRNTIALVIDVSGSMEEEVVLPEKMLEGRGTSRHNLTHHLVKVITKLLPSHSRYTIIFFGSTTKIIVPFSWATESNKIDTLNTLDREYANPLNSSTNTLNGILTAYSLLDTELTSNPLNGNVSIILLSDGKSDQNVDDILINDNYVRYKNKMEFVPVHTIGFSKDCDSRSLQKISSNTNGKFTFIPDATTIGGAGVMSVMSPILSSLYVNSKLKINDTIIPISFIRNQSIRSIPIMITPEMADFRSLSITSKGSIANIINFEAVNYSAKPEEELFLLVQKLISCIESILKIPSERLFISSIISLKEELYKIADIAREKNFIELANDIENDEPSYGQICKAIENYKQFNSWGYHYLIAIKEAFNTQTKAGRFELYPSLYVKDSSFYKAIEKNGINIYEKTAAPPSTHAHKYNIRTTVPPVRQYNPNFSNTVVPNYNSGFSSRVVPNYNSGGFNAYIPQVDDNFSSDPCALNRYGGCFDGEGIVYLKDGTFKHVKDLIKGDKLENNATIECLVISEINAPIEIVDINGIQITPWHPIKMNDYGWCFPIDLESYPIRFQHFNRIYNVVVLDGNSIIINGIECITLGHNILNDDVASHEFFGTDMVIDELSNRDGWNDGKVIISGEVHRDNRTNIVIGFK